MSAARLIGLTAAAAIAVADARNSPELLIDARSTLGTAFNGLNAEETGALGSAARALLEPEARRTGDYRAWAEICWFERLGALHEAAAPFRDRLDAEVARRGEQKAYLRRAEPGRNVPDPRRQETARAALRMLRLGVPSLELLNALHIQNIRRADPLPVGIVADTAIWAAQVVKDRANER